MKKTILLFLALLISNSDLLTQNLKWEKLFNPPIGMNLYGIFGITKSIDNNLYLIYSLSDTMPLRHDPALMKISPEGEVLWSFYQINEKRIFPSFISQDVEKLRFYGIRVKFVNMEIEWGYTPYVYMFNNTDSLLYENFEPEPKGIIFENKGALLMTKDSLLLHIGYKNRNIIIKEYDKNANYLQDIKLDTTFIAYVPTHAFQDKDSNLYIFGSGNYKKDNKNFIIKLSKKYEYIWTALDTLEPDKEDLTTVLFNEDSIFTLLGKINPSYQMDTAKTRYYIKRYDKNGKLLANKDYYNIKYMYFNDIKRFDNGCYLVTGDSGRPALYTSVFYMMKTDGNGEKIWEKSWGDIFLANVLNKSLITEDKLIYAAGSTEGLLYVACLKDEPVGVYENVPFSNSLIGNPGIFPNPASESIRIVLESNMGSHTRIVLLDNTGRAIKALFEEYMPAGKYCLELPLPQVSPGCYNIQINSGAGVRSEKVIINK